MNLTSSLKSLRPLMFTVGAQAVVSAASFLSGLVLLRLSTTEQYGYFVLMNTSVLFVLAVQGGFFQPQSVRVARQENPELRGLLIGGLLKTHRRIALITFLSSVLVLGLGTLIGLIRPALALLILGILLACFRAMIREVQRTILMACRDLPDVLKADTVYGFVLVGGVYLVTLSLSDWAGAAAAVVLALAATGASHVCRHALYRQGAKHNETVPPVTLRELAHIGSWGFAGSVVQWTFTQGYTYVVAAQLGATALAAISATRLLLMPINLLSGGLAQFIMPAAAQWLNRYPLSQVVRRLATAALLLLVATSLYSVLMWQMRDFIFGTLMHKHFDDRDGLLLLWIVVFSITVVRDIMGYILAARLKYRILSTITLFSAAAAIMVTLLCLGPFGGRGALFGLLTGEILNLLGILGAIWWALVGQKQENRIAANTLQGPAE